MGDGGDEGLEEARHVLSHHVENHRDYQEAWNRKVGNRKVSSINNKTDKVDKYYLLYSPFNNVK